MLFELSKILSVWVFPVMILLILIFAAVRRIRVYKAFVEGAGEGFSNALKIMPFLVAMLLAINIFRASGAMGVGISCLKPILSSLGILLQGYWGIWQECWLQSIFAGYCSVEAVDQQDCVWM